jgi:signal transduction histidine kinase
MTSRALEEVREITQNLRPYHLDRLGLKEALEFMTEGIANLSKIHFSSAIDTIDGLLSKEAEMHLYRIVQEAANNIIKHSGATEARVTLQRKGRLLQLSIEDNGQGFFSNSRVVGSYPRGFGLTGISERVRILGGVESIVSIPGQGTTITMSMRLSERDEGHE